MPAIRRALISVSDKSGLVELAAALAEQGVEILSTGGTAKLIRESGIAVTMVADYTGAPEILDGRVKTLHPKIHGGLLGRPIEAHEEDDYKAWKDGIKDGTTQGQGYSFGYISDSLFDDAFCVC